MDAAQALGELMELSSQITAAVVLDAEGVVLASSAGDPTARQARRGARSSSSRLPRVSAATVGR